jgi:hypothetical protein
MLGSRKHAACGTEHRFVGMKVRTFVYLRFNEGKGWHVELDSVQNILEYQKACNRRK